MWSSVTSTYGSNSQRLLRADERAARLQLGGVAQRRRRTGSAHHTSACPAGCSSAAPASARTCATSATTAASTRRCCPSTLRLLLRRDDLRRLPQPHSDASRATAPPARSRPSSARRWTPASTTATRTAPTTSSATSAPWPRSCGTTSMGGTYWPALGGKPGTIGYDWYSMYALSGSGTNLNLTVRNTSGADRLRYAWGDTVDPDTGNGAAAARPCGSSTCATAARPWTSRQLDRRTTAEIIQYTCGGARQPAVAVRGRRQRLLAHRQPRTAASAWT